MAKRIEVPALVGAKIVAVKAATSEQLELMGLDDDAYCLLLELDNGVLVGALRDEEGNGPGVMTGLLGGDNFYIDLEG